MIGQSLVFVCATLALVAGTCIETPLSQGVISSGCSSPIATVSSVGCNSILSSGLGLASGLGFGSGVGLRVPITDGPHGTPITVIQAPPVTLPAVQTPIVPLPSPPIPSTRVISQRCICTKTIVKPQIYQRLVTVPKIQRYLKRTVTPVVENLSYKATPISPVARMGLGTSVVVASGSPIVGARLATPIVRSGLSSPVIVSRPSAVCSC